MTELFKEYIKNPNRTGNIVKSSLRLRKFLAKNARKKKIVVELGGGPGNVTSEIIKNLDKKAKLIVFELNKEFYNNLKAKIKDNRVKIVNDSAINVSKHIKNVDCIISTLPLLSLQKKEVDKIIENSHKVLRKNGIFVQIQYFYPASYKHLKSIYSKVKVKLVVLNFPFPTFVYLCRK